MENPTINRPTLLLVHWERSTALEAGALAVILKRLGASLLTSEQEFLHTAAFGSAVNAAAAAFALRHGSAAPPGTLRMAIHTSASPTATEADLTHCTHLLAAARPGQVILSGAAQVALLRSALPEGARLCSIGRHHLRDLGAPEELYLLEHDGEVGPPSTPNTLDTLPNNLPVQLTRFIGRQRELDALCHLLRDARLVTVTGPGGSGKTRLSLQAAAQLAARFGGGIWFVELATLCDPELISHEIAGVLGVRDLPGRTVISLLQAALGRDSVLLVLDNCEHLVGAVADLAERLLQSCPQLVILATSREPLGIGGESVFRVPPLTLPESGEGASAAALMESEAVRLFLDRATGVQPGFAVTPSSAPYLTEICRRLDGMPLAIELAASRVKILSLEQIAARLGERFRLLTCGSRTATARQQTLRGAILWSHDLLGEPERVLWRRLSVFTGSFSLSAAEGICAGPDGPLSAEEILDLLAELVEKSLVQVEGHGGENRYRLLESIREFGLEMLRECGEHDRLHARHRDWYLHLAEASALKFTSPEQAAWLLQVSQEYDNLRSALRWAWEHHQPEIALRFAAAIWWYWYIRGHISEGTAILHQVLTAPEPKLARAEALCAAGMLAREQGELEQAEARALEGLTLSQAIGSRSAEARSLNILGIVALDRGRFEEASAHFNECLSILSELNDRWAMARALGNLGYIALKLGQYQLAQERFEASLAFSRELKDLNAQTLTLNFLGLVAQRLKDRTRAEMRYREALDLGQTLGDQRNIARALCSLGSLALARDDLARAETHLAEALRLREAIGDRAGIAECLEPMAAVSLRGAAPARAAQLLGAAAALRTSIGAPVPPDDRQLVDTTAAGARKALGAAEYESWTAVGALLTVSAAVALALDSRSDGPSDADRAREPVPATPTPRRDSTVESLTARERQVLQLAAEGLTTRQIAARLNVSPHTVEKHEENMRAKLHISNRAGLVAWAIRQGVAPG